MGWFAAWGCTSALCGELFCRDVGKPGKFISVYYIIPMRKFRIACSFSTIAAFGLFSCGLHKWENPLTEERMVEALQEALVLGSQTAASNLGDASCASSVAAVGDCATGYLGNKLVEIALPDTVKNVLDNIDAFVEKFDDLPSAVTSLLNTQFSISGLRGYGDKIKTALNKGAEQAAPESVALFKNAIFDMSFDDARGILFGSVDTAATDYLKKTTFTGLQGVFGGILKEHLNGLNINSFWHPIASNYNSFADAYLSKAVSDAVYIYNLNPANNKISLPKLPYNNLEKDISGHLSTYATGKALDGLFKMVGKQEGELRADPWGTVSALGGFITDTVGDLLGDVFSKAKEG
jgi:hypothetical protein